MSIKVQDLVAGYIPDVPILNEVSLTVETGSIVTVIGPNGSGKSTLLKAIVGAVAVTRGLVYLEGQPLAGLPMHQRVAEHGIAYVPQLDNVFGPLTVRENLDLGGIRLTRAARRRRITELLDIYPTLADRLGQRADSQSGGERQMLAIARALMAQPSHLLLDEPSAGLSPLMAERVFEMLAQLRRRADVTILLVEQNAVDSLAISDRGLVLVAGQVALEAAASDLLSDPRLSGMYLGGASEVTGGTASSPVSAKHAPGASMTSGTRTEEGS